jgi:hypothetical protein
LARLRERSPANERAGDFPPSLSSIRLDHLTNGGGGASDGDANPDASGGGANGDASDGASARDGASEHLPA